MSGLKQDEEVSEDEKFQLDNRRYKRNVSRPMEQQKERNNISSTVEIDYNNGNQQQQQQSVGSSLPPLSTESRITEVGTSSFYDLVAVNDIYVDKSLFVKEFLNSADKVILITRPSKWGKTINMDMLKNFLAIEQPTTTKQADEPQSELLTAPPPRQRSTEHYKLFAGGEIRLDDGRSKILPPLNVAKFPDIMEHQGRYPVLWVTFKNIEGKKYEEIENGLRKRIRLLYLDHSYLEHSDRLNANERLLLGSYLAGNFDAEDLKTSLYFLSRLLKTHHGKQVYVFIDEYDTPVRNVYVKIKEQTKRANKVLLTKVFRHTYLLFRAISNECLKDNEYLKKGFLTGILRLDIAISGLSNLGEYSLLNEPFNQFYGFDQSEVDGLVDRLPSLLKVVPLEIKRWYRGFNYGKRVLYNPWSVMQCLKNYGLFKPYWIQSDEASLIDKKLLRHKFRQDVRKIVIGETCTVVTDNEFDFKIMDTRDGLFNALLFLGYLNPINQIGNRCNVSMPNEEIRMWYDKQVGNE